MGACSLSTLSQMSHGEKYLVAMTMELVSILRHKSCIAPLSFMRNLMSYADKVSMLRLDAANSPGGNYTTVRSWLINQANATTPVCPSGDIILVFDNDQVVGKTYKVQPNNEVRSSVITNCALVQLDPNGTIQEDSELSPGKEKVVKRSCCSQFGP